jgi:hypothetical protein
MSCPTVRRRGLVTLVAVVTGLVLFTPGAAAQEADGSCPVEVGPAPLADRAEIPDAHRTNVDCAFDQGITVGVPRADGGREYQPVPSVRRDQMASFIARTLEAAGRTLPSPTDAGFTDIANSVHRDRINQLAAIGVVEGRDAQTYAPADPVRRDQMASFVVRAAEYAVDRELDRPADDRFEDSARSFHHDAIEKAAEARLALGRLPDEFAVADPTRRDQMASFLIRVLTFVTDEVATQVSVAADRRTAPVDHPVTVTALAQNVFGQAVPDVEVDFSADGAAPEPDGAAGTTGSDGQATFSFTSRETGDVEVTAALETPDEVVPQGAVTVTFELDVRGLSLDQDRTVSRTGDEHTLVAGLTDAEDEPVPDAWVRFEVDSDGEPEPAEDDRTTDAQGQAVFTYTNSEPGSDEITACANGDGSRPDSCDDAELVASLDHAWVAAEDGRALLLGNDDASGVVERDE